MTENKNEHRGGNTFFWGLIIGATFATLLSTQKGRKILHDLTDLGLELIEDFIDERVGKDSLEKETEEVQEDIESEVAEVDVPEKGVGTKPDEKTEEIKENPSNPIKSDSKNGSLKKRLFKGIRRK
ncbi:MAG: hypothetical protein A3C27_00320 [Candidatus Levybacteria bacterium RIFCSPHIGHO2_02_FULL_39_36]|nr:MAG: hypothetical protein UT20_C0015G0013 [Candidatus Levybacteria bacterium GW2011_GWA1_39_11]KKR24795.1 MAG: hypothetical protein UT56_C0008G0012 [Candidatus Levybacteria bacterium GW2011_GWB1_39_7]KKR27265.1 MAG: hypothetical protein UT57_C0012G0004 [Microgenomates group bacterium GW2011_GWC1_39_7]KKR49569.1 MAG: hypothetical protein UT85_C0015G0004 [Candidatus Levybacteria bacterium GW2011_GWA2_40_16]OGH15567.1 MAG: hypothetical protein A2689_03120 [Candidatus Levybacteria bacterium RIFC